MKKLGILLLSLTFVLSLSACALFTGEEAEDIDVNIPDEFPEEDISLTMWHAFGEDNQALLDQMFDEFTDEYPNVEIEQLSQGGYDGLRESTVQGIVSGTMPDIVMGYPDHFVEYLNGNALVPLDEYADHDDFGTDLDDFIPGFLEENQQYADGNMYSLPLFKSTEMVVYNKTVMDYFFEDDDNIEFSLDQPLTWDDIEYMEEQIEWDDEAMDELVENRDAFPDEAGIADHDEPFLINIDSAANFFINSTYQWDGEYTDQDGNILVDNENNRDMLHYFDGLFDDEVVAMPIEWDENYGSTPFSQGLTLMSQGSTAGARHNIPSHEDGAFGTFDMGVVPAIQKHASEDEGTMSAQQQGPNIAIMSETTDEERLAAWKLIEFMTNTENTAFFSMETGYMPVRTSAFQTDEYQDYLALAEEDIDDLEGDERDDYPFALANAAAQAQEDYYRFDPAFVGRITSSSARQQSENLFESIYAGTRDVDEAIAYMLDQLGAN